MRFLKKQGVYLALALALFAAGLGGALSLSKSGVQEVERNASGVRDTSRVSSASKTEVSSRAQSAPAITPQSSRPASSQAPAPFFVLPVAGGEIMKGFDGAALQYSDTYRDWRLHTGVDFKAAAGTKVCAAGSGTVTDIYTDERWGSCVKIDHGNGIEATYCGLNAQPVVKAGQSVSAGTELGVVDTIPAESVEPAHLHLEVRVNGEGKDPLKVFGFAK